jgi:predicted DsbA family dithiol-disulfide isomerase
MSLPFRPALAPVALAVALVACSPASQTPQAEDPGAVVATLNGAEIHEADLETWIRDQLYAEATQDKDESELHEFRIEWLERMIEDRLLAAEAEKRGLDLAGLQRETVGDLQIPDEQVATFFEQNKERLAQASFEDLAPRIRDFLLQQTRAQEWSRFVSGLREAADVRFELEPPRTEVAALGPLRGPADAPVTVVEFSDFNCPFCQSVNATLEALRERYPTQVRIVFRHFPLDQLHPRARPIAEASVCAEEQGRFWEFHDRVFADGAALADDAIRATAEASGLDLSAFEACLAAGRAKATVERDVEAGQAAGVTGTPAFFVNGIRLSGAQPLEAFVRVIEQELARGDEAASS